MKNFRPKSTFVMCQWVKILIEWTMAQKALQNRPDFRTKRLKLTIKLKKTNNWVQSFKTTALWQRSSAKILFLWWLILMLIPEMRELYLRWVKFLVRSDECSVANFIQLRLWSTLAVEQNLTRFTKLQRV